MAFGVKKFASQEQRQASPPVSIAGESSAALAAQIDVKKSEHAAALAQVETLLGKPIVEKTFEVDVIAAQFRAPTLEAALGLRDQIIAAQFNARSIAVKLQFLESQRRAAREAEQCGGAVRYAERLDTIGRKLIAALKIAAQLNDEAAQTHEAARGELSDGVTGKYLVTVVFNGMLRSDLVDTWATATERALSITRRKLEGLPQSETPLPVPKVTIAPVKATIQTPKAKPAQLERVRGTFAVRAPDDVSPLQDGEVRARSLADGWCPADDRPQTHRGQLVRMPRAAAECARAKGLIEIVNETVGEVAVEGATK